jgi:hypothetical protein
LAAPRYGKQGGGARQQQQRNDDEDEFGDTDVNSLLI